MPWSICVSFDWTSAQHCQTDEYGRGGGRRTFEERSVVVAGDRETLDDRVEQLPDDLLRVRTASRECVSARLVHLDCSKERGAYPR